MADGHATSARQAHSQPDQPNKYARVIREAVAEKRTRQDLVDDRRIMNRASNTPTWPPVGDT